MFKLFRKKPEIQQQNFLDKFGLFLVQDAVNLLNEPNLQMLLYELKQLISVTQSNYQSLYLELIYKFAEFVQGLPDKTETSYDCPKGLLQHALIRAIAALKYRRGYMLPVGADTETCYKQQEVWTYAVFTAALLKDIWQVVALFKVTIFDPAGNEQNSWRPLSQLAMIKNTYYRFQRNPSCQLLQANINSLLTKQLIPAAGFRWINEYETLFEYWLNYLSGHLTPQNIIAEIIQKAELSINPVKHKKILEDSKEIEESNNNVIVNEAEKQAEKSMKNEEKLIADVFISWVKCGIKQDYFSVNLNESFLHRIKDGFFMAMPVVLDKFLEENSQYNYLFQKQDKNKAELLIQELKSSNYLIPVNADCYLHEFYMGEWRDRCILQGLLLNNELFPEILSKTSMNRNLHREQNIY